MNKDFTYNDEFFLNDDDKKLLESQAPNVAFAFYDSEISIKFRKIDDRANQSKREFQFFGYLTVGLATAALVLAVFESIYILPRAKDGVGIFVYVSYTIAFIAATAGILSMVIGGWGLGIGKVKRNWMADRLKTESIRLWQSQYRCAHIKEIFLAVQNSETDAYVNRRRVAFSVFEKEFLNQIGGHLPIYIGSSSEIPALWLDTEFERKIQSHNVSSVIDSYYVSENLQAEFFETHNRVRFRAQLRYTTWKLDDYKFRTHALTQERLLARAGNSSLIATLVLHISVLVGLLSGIEELKSSIVHALAVVAALIALAVRVLEDGLRPGAELARLRSYLLDVRESNRRYEETSLIGEKIRQMALMEEAASRELQVFMKSVATARFLL